MSTGADLLIGAHDMGPTSVMSNLEAAGMRVEYAPDSTGPDRFTDKVRFVADVLEMPQRGAELIAAYDAELEKVRARAAALSRKPRVLLFLSVRDGAPIAAGTGTTGHDIIEVTGGQNVAQFDGWQPMNSEAIIVAAPDIIVMSSLHMQRLGGVDTLMGRDDVAATPAGANQSYAVLSPHLLLQFGPRAPIAMNDLITAFETLPAS